MKTTLKFALLAAVCCASVHAADKPQVDCVKVSFSIKEEVASNQSLVLQIVEKAVLANQDCACEVVKSAITATQADNKLIASIVEVAAMAAPEKMRLIAQCAVAVAPDSLTDVQAVLAKLDPGTSNGGKSGKEVTEKGGLEEDPSLAEDPELNPDGTPKKPVKPPGILDRPSGPMPFFIFKPFVEDTNPATDNNQPNFPG